MKLLVRSAIVLTLITLLFSTLVLAAGNTDPNCICPELPPVPEPVVKLSNTILNNKNEPLITCFTDDEDKNFGEFFTKLKTTSSANGKKFLSKLSCTEPQKCIYNDACVSLYVDINARYECEAQGGDYDSQANEKCLEQFPCKKKGEKCTTDLASCCSKNCGPATNGLTANGAIPESVCLDPKPLPVCCYNKPLFPITGNIDVQPGPCAANCGSPGNIFKSCKTCYCGFQVDGDKYPC